MAKTSPTKLFIFFVFFASFRILETLAPTSAFVHLTIPHNFSSCVDAGAYQSPWKYVKAEVPMAEGSCDESDMESFENAVNCTRALLLNHGPYHAANFVRKLHRHNAGKGEFFTDALLTKIDLNPPFVDEDRRMGDRKTMLDGCRKGLALLQEGLDQLETFEEMGFHASEEIEFEEEDEEDFDDDDDNDGDDDNDSDGDDEFDQYIEVNFLD